MAHYVKVVSGIVVQEQGGPDEFSKEIICGADADLFISADLSVRLGWVVAADGSFSPPAAPSGPTTAEISARAQSMLDASSAPVLDFLEAGDPVPDAWRAYRSSLRTIVSSGAVPSDGWPTAPSA